MDSTVILGCQSNAILGHTRPFKWTWSQMNVSSNEKPQMNGLNEQVSNVIELACTSSF